MFDDQLEREETMRRVLPFLLLMVVGMAFVMADCSAQRNKGDRKMRDRERMQRGRNSNALKVGQKAPGFKLKSLDGKSETELSSFKGKKPVVLIFGSYT